jgi:hypothetical protein
MDIYDTITKQWQKNLPGLKNGKPRSPALVCVNVNNIPKIYAFGGGSSRIEVYDINSGMWDHFAGTCPTRISNNTETTAVVYNGKVHFSNDWGDTFIFDPATGTWWKMIQERTANWDALQYIKIPCTILAPSSTSLPIPS